MHASILTPSLCFHAPNKELELKSMANTLNCMSGKEVPSSVSISGRTQSGTRDRAGHTKTLASGGTGITDARLTGPFSSGIQAVTAFGHPLARPDSSLLGTGILISVQSIEAVCCLGLHVFWASMDVPFHDASFVYCKLMCAVRHSEAHRLLRLPAVLFQVVWRECGPSKRANETRRQTGDDRRACQIDRTHKYRSPHVLRY
ncbi:hypothetical protein J3E68DRAFT_417280 [Trichoderma sp. SZMC 28012]